MLLYIFLNIIFIIFYHYNYISINIICICEIVFFIVLLAYYFKITLGSFFSLWWAAALMEWPCHWIPAPVLPRKPSPRVFSLLGLLSSRHRLQIQIKSKILIRFDTQRFIQVWMLGSAISLDDPRGAGGRICVMLVNIGSGRLRGRVARFSGCFGGVGASLV